MTQLIGLSITNTFQMNINGVQYTIRFAENVDEFVIFVSNDVNGNQQKYHFDRDTANDFNHYHGELLHDEMLKIIQADIQNGLI